MLRVLLLKDLRRAWRNPLPFLINLIVPLAMTALIGMVFGGRGDNNSLGRIRFGIVDEDQTVLTDFLRNAPSQKEAGKYLEPVYLERAEALRQLNESKLSGVVIIPTNFMHDYLTARSNVSLTLIKNPAESIHPAVLEQMMAVVVTGLNAVSRNFNEEFPRWEAVFKGDVDYHEAAALVDREGDKFKTIKKFINPPLVSYTKDAEETNLIAVTAVSASTNSSASLKTDSSKKPATVGRDTNGVFAFLLIGLAAMFLLFLANNAMTDLHRELRKRTLERYQTLRVELWPFIVSKVIYTIVVLAICIVVMLGGGGLIFGIHWEQPGRMLALALAYACFVASLFAVLVAVVPDERRAGVLNNLAAMGLGFVGGCAFPARQLPAFLREHVTPLMPSNWFVTTARSLQFDSSGVVWIPVLLKLAVASVVCVLLATALFRRKFKTGLRA